jgi:DNA polymerase III subunit epsilon
MKLNLKRPIVFFDIEATGLNVVSDRIVEISILKINPDASEESKTYRLNPTIPIEASALAIHGITNEEVKDLPKFSEIAPALAQFIKGADIAGYNSNKFDIPLLAEEFIRADVDFEWGKHKIIDVQVIFHKMEQRTLSAAYKFYCDKELQNAHNAMADTKATYEVLESQLERYKELQNDISFLAEFSSHTRNVDFAGRIIFNENDVEVFNFGKHKGVPVEEVLEKDRNFYNWMLNSDFPLYTKKVLTAIKLRTAFNNLKMK